MAEVNGGTAPQTNGHPSASPPSQSIAPSQHVPVAIPVSNPTVPLTSLQDNGLSKRPRDARLIHMILSSLGVSAYQERVPLQLLDFAYRHSSSILSDAIHLSSDASIAQQSRAPGSSREVDGHVSANAVQLAISSRLQYQFSGASGISKEFLLETAQARNKTALPRVLQNEWGIRLPSERFVLTGVPWGLKEEWEGGDETSGADGMEGVEATEDQVIEEIEGEGTMDDLFGATEEDQDMENEE